MGITEFLAKYITVFIEHTGYITVFVGMVMESMVFPVPSEAIMPFAGFLIYEGRFSFFGVIGVSTAASIVGSLISYWMGYYGGKPFVDRFGKYFLIDHEELAMTERFFKKYGDAAVFISRFIPVIRHLVSIPAGVGGMNFLKFIVLTTIGAGLWNAFLTVAGYYLRQNWEQVMHYSKAVDIAVLLILLLLVGLFVVRHCRKLRKSKILPSDRNS